MGDSGSEVGAWMRSAGPFVICCVQSMCVRVTWVCVTVCAGVSLVGVCVPVSFDTDYMKLIRGFTLATSLLYTRQLPTPSLWTSLRQSHLYPRCRGLGEGTWCQPPGLSPRSRGGCRRN